MRIDHVERRVVELQRLAVANPEVTLASKPMQVEVLPGQLDRSLGRRAAAAAAGQPPPEGSEEAAAILPIDVE